MTPTEIEKLKERTEQHVRDFGFAMDAACGHVRIDQLLALFAALSAKDAGIERLVNLLVTPEEVATLQQHIKNLTRRAEAAEAALKEAREGGVIIDREHLRNLLKVLRNYPKLASVKAAEALLSKQGE